MSGSLPASKLAQPVKQNCWRATVQYCTRGIAVRSSRFERWEQMLQPITGRPSRGRLTAEPSAAATVRFLHPTNPSLTDGAFPSCIVGHVAAKCPVLPLPMLRRRFLSHSERGDSIRFASTYLRRPLDRVPGCRYYIRDSDSRPMEPAWLHPTMTIQWLFRLSCSSQNGQAASRWKCGGGAG